MATQAELYFLADVSTQLKLIKLSINAELKAQEAMTTLAERTASHARIVALANEASEMVAKKYP